MKWMDPFTMRDKTTGLGAYALALMLCLALLPLQPAAPAWSAQSATSEASSDSTWQGLKDKLQGLAEALEGFDFDSAAMISQASPENATGAVIPKATQEAIEQRLEEAQRQIEEAMENASRGAEEALRGVLEGLAEVDWERTLEEAMKSADEAMRLAGEEFSQAMEKMEENMRRFSESMDAPGEPGELPAPPAPSVPFAPSVDEIRQQFIGETVSVNTFEVFDVSDAVDLSVNASFAEVTVLPAEDAGQVLVKLEITAGAEDQAAAETILEQFDWAIEREGNTISVQVETPGDQPPENSPNQNRIKIARIEVLAPKDMPVSIENAFGSVHVYQMTGPVQCDNSYGPLLVQRTRGPLTLNNEFGPLNIRDHRGESQVRANFGEVSIAGLAGESTLRVSYGNSKLEGLSPDLTLTMNYEFGDVMITLPEGYDGGIDAAVSMGDLTPPQSIQDEEEMFAQSVKTELGSGDGRIRVHGSFGDLTLQFMEPVPGTR